MKTSPPYWRERAYRVPFRAQRDAASDTISILNDSREPLDGVTLTLHGSGIMRSNYPTRLRPGESLEVTVAGKDLPRNTILVVRWFRTDGVEYLWRLSF